MTKRNTIIILTALILILIIGFGLIVKYGAKRNQDTLFAKLYVVLFNDNELTIDLHDKINPESIRITDNSGTVIYKDGRIVRNIDNEYGHVIFNFYEDNKLFAQGGHFKTNWWHTHDYEIFVDWNNGVKNIKLDIQGPNKNNDDFIKYIYDKGNDSIQFSSFRTNGDFINEWTEKK